jgi:hypothetical protein
VSFTPSQAPFTQNAVRSPAHWAIIHIQGIEELNMTMAPTAEAGNDPVIAIRQIWAR